MNTATDNSKRSRPATGRLLAVLGVFWLNLVVAPCALAFGSEHDCPHCPAEQAGEMAAHHGHHEATAGCDALTSDCDEIQTYAHEARTNPVKLKDKAEPVPMAPAVIPDTPVHSLTFVTTTADPPDPGAVFPALHLLNCVFLD